MIKIYTDRTFLTESNRRKVFPLLFDLHYVLNENLNRLYSITNSIEKSDIAVLPLSLNYFYDSGNKKYVNNFISKAKEAKKEIWIYTAGDYGITIADSDIYNFRVGGFHSKLNDKTFVMPSFISDPYLNYFESSFVPRQKTDRPIIGFVGNAQSGLKKYFKEFILYLTVNLKRILKIDFTDLQQFYPSAKNRYELLQLLNNNSHIESNFIFRKQYRAGARTEEEKTKTTSEYFENMLQSQYIFCIRGSGNFSVRFYEALSMGKIPLFIDTDCRLPLSDLIDWTKHCIVVSERDSKKSDKILIDWHSKISNERFLYIQESNRDLWKTYLSRDSYFSIIHDKFNTR
jgi:Exostosin family